MGWNWKRFRWNATEAVFYNIPPPPRQYILWLGEVSRCWHVTVAVIQTQQQHHRVTDNIFPAGSTWRFSRDGCRMLFYKRTSVTLGFCCCHCTLTRSVCCKMRDEDELKVVKWPFQFIFHQKIGLNPEANYWWNWNVIFIIAISWLCLGIVVFLLGLNELFIST